ncbi:hypothetical protein [Sporomusa malonica]|uniref:hypothetical protein n=1 Tax=Sporomusa malonica TaxID=112901 RepID=UPI00159448C6|nr:hypothetical protein [Sporomusa malonica]
MQPGQEHHTNFLRPPGQKTVKKLLNFRIILHQMPIIHHHDSRPCPPSGQFFQTGQQQRKCHFPVKLILFLHLLPVPRRKAGNACFQRPGQIKRKIIDVVILRSCGIPAARQKVILQRLHHCRGFPIPGAGRNDRHRVGIQFSDDFRQQFSLDQTVIQPGHGQLAFQQYYGPHISFHLCNLFQSFYFSGTYSSGCLGLFLGLFFSVSGFTG